MQIRTVQQDMVDILEAIFTWTVGIRESGWDLFSVKGNFEDQCI